MKNQDKKLSGSYYTPYKTVSFMQAYLAKENKRFNSILEPSAGDGRFVDKLGSENNVQNFVAIELMEDKVKQLNDKKYPDHIKIIQNDFLDFADRTKEKYQLIIGNPPYISIKNMAGSSIDKARNMCEKYQLPNTMMKNIWVAFVLAAVSCLEKCGVIFFVLPMEFLQVQYAEKIRLFLEEQFDTIHILSFKERMFSEIEQETCLVYLTNEYKNHSHINFKIYDKLDDAYPSYCSKIERNKPLRKWTNAILSDEEIDLLNIFELKYKKVSQLCEASPGIVTGATNEFILTRTQVDELKCQDFVLPAIPKSSMVNGCFILTSDLVHKIGMENNRIYLLNLSQIKKELFPQALKEYLQEIGEKKNSSGIRLKDRYKCRNRSPWFGVPIVRNGDIFFFKRYDKIPRICVNEAGIYTTDIAYNMRLDPNYDKESLAFCFYNSLTLTLCEYYGRFYAGGVSELTPSEFKRISIPYREIERNDIERLSEMFAENADTDEIIRFVNSKTIGREWEEENVMRLEKMRKKLMERRLL